MTTDTESAMPALAETMITALEKRFSTVAAFVELDTFATSHWYLESARCVSLPCYSSNQCSFVWQLRHVMSHFSISSWIAALSSTLPCPMVKSFSSESR